MSSSEVDESKVRCVICGGGWTMDVVMDRRTTTVHMASYVRRRVG
jgi:hypothetical protein